MKKIVLQKIIAAMALTTAVGYAGLASAHTVPGALGKAASAVDVWQTTCSKDKGMATGRLLTKIKAGKGAALVSVQAIKGRMASHITDATSGDIKYSPDALLKGGGEGVYTVLVNKDKAGAMSYVLDVHCQTTAGGHSGQIDDPKLFQNQ